VPDELILAATAGSPRPRKIRAGFVSAAHGHGTDQRKHQLRTRSCPAAHRKPPMAKQPVIPRIVPEPVKPTRWRWRRPSIHRTSYWPRSSRSAARRGGEARVAAEHAALLIVARAVTAGAIAPEKRRLSEPIYRQCHAPQRKQPCARCWQIWKFCLGFRDRTLTSTQDRRGLP